MKTINFPYINGTEVPVSENSLYLNSSWVHPSKDSKWSNHFVWELDVIQKFVDQIQDDFVVLDIGANTGTFSLAAKYYTNTKWHLFEPDPFNYNLLIENLKINQIDNVSLYKEALSDKVGDGILKICPNHRGLNTIGNDVKRFSESESINHPIKLNTIDNLFLNTRIDLIKMDTEGSEYDIIKGGIETIRKYKPKILLEYNAGNMSQCGHSMEELNTLIEQINYETFWFDNGENLFIQSR
jgi:FkbM family methyltransferase